MEPKTSKSPESVVRAIKRKTRRKFNSEEKIRIILEGSGRIESCGVWSGSGSRKDRSERDWLEGNELGRKQC